MPRFESFRALRYSSRLLPEVTAPPYDVLSPSERELLARRHAHNVVHIDFPLESEGPNRYEAAARLIETWRKEEVLSLDDEPSLTVYRMRFVDDAGHVRTTSGVIGALEVVDEGAGGVLPHERTTPKAKTDRLDLTRTTQCNLSPVWGLSLGTGLTAALKHPGEPLGSVETHGVEHSFERISDPERIAHICSIVSANEVVIADGHHRYAVSRTYRDELRSLRSPIAREAETTMAYVAELVEDQLSVAAIHRLYDLSDPDGFEATLRRYFEFVDCPFEIATVTRWMQDNSCLVLLRHGAPIVGLRPRSDQFAGVRDLDGSRLEHALVNVPHEVRYQHGVSEVLHYVESGQADAAVLIRPVTVDEIRRTADEHELMPPKSTFFTPKILTGVTIRSLAG